MGSLGNTIYIDSNIIIYIVERAPRYYASLASLLSASAQGLARVITSELSVLECLVVPMRTGDQAMVSAYLQIFSQTDLSCIPINRDVLMEAAQLRAQYPALRTPDSIHWATARIEGADRLLTNDQNLLRLAAGFAIDPSQLTI